MKTIKSKDGTSIAFDRIGNGQPIIFVDGAFCSRSFGPMTKLAKLLAKTAFIVSIDVFVLLLALPHLSEDLGTNSIQQL
jgi:hypothetical protein